MNKKLLVASSDPVKPNWYLFDGAGWYDYCPENILQCSRVWYSIERTAGWIEDWQNGTVFATGPGGIWIFNKEAKLLGKRSDWIMLPVIVPCLRIKNIVYNKWYVCAAGEDEELRFTRFNGFYEEDIDRSVSTVFQLKINMKAYHTTNGIILEQARAIQVAERRLEQLHQWWWCVAKAKSGFHSTAEVSASAIADILPPIGQQPGTGPCRWCYSTCATKWEDRKKVKPPAALIFMPKYEAERPEVFFKSTPHRIAGSNGFVRIRKDSTWDVPEPELTLVVTSSGKIVAIPSAMIWAAGA